MKTGSRKNKLRTGSKLIFETHLKKIVVVELTEVCLGIAVKEGKKGTAHLFRTVVKIRTYVMKRNK